MNRKKKRVLLLGASGSIGKSTLEVLRNYTDSFELAGFSVHTNLEFANKINQEFPNASFCSTKGNSNIAIRQLIEKSKPDIVVNGIAGSQGLRASFETIHAGVDLALANKETIVSAGELIFKDAKAKIIPVDSEHSAIFNLINAHGRENIKKIIITASGGPFRNTPKKELENITVKDALNHPTWKMGDKITIDSASLANKALEVIEAVKLFNMPAEKIEVTVHPQSIVHSMVQTMNGEVYAQMSPPDMCNPIFEALSFPNHANAKENFSEMLDFSKIINLEFIPPRLDDFPMLKLGFEVARKLKAYPIAFNIANEEAVKAFFDNKIKFTDLHKIVESVLCYDWNFAPKTYNAVYEIEDKVKQITKDVVASLIKVTSKN